MISDTNCPVALVPAPPAVKVPMVPEESMLPAKVPATPPAVVVTSPYAGREPTTPEETVVPELITFTASPCVNVSVKLIAAPSVVCEYVPEFIVAAAVALAGAVRPPRVAETLFPVTEYELPILVACDADASTVS